MLDYWARKAIDDEIKRRGWWYPPDLLDAIAEGRDTYHPLDPKISYAVEPGHRRAYEPLLDKHLPRWRERGLSSDHLTESPAK